MTRAEALIVLGVPAEVEPAEVESAYRRLMRTVHPDVCSGPEAGRLSRQAAEARRLLRETLCVGEPSAPRGEARWGPVPDPPGSVPGTPWGVVHDSELARTVVLVVQAAAGSLSMAEVIGEVRASGDWDRLPLDVRDAVFRRLCEPDFWGFGSRSGLWEVCGRDVVLPPDQNPSGYSNVGSRSRPRSQFDKGWKPDGSAGFNRASEHRVEQRIYLVALVAVALFGVVMVLAFLYQEAASRLDSGASVVDLPALPPWTGLAFALDPDLVDLAAVSSYGCAGLVGASASVVSVGAEHPLEVCGFSASTRLWERVTDDVEVSVDSQGSATVVVLGDGRVWAVAPGRADVTAQHGWLSASIRLQVLP